MSMLVAILAFSVWLYLLLARGRFWLTRTEDDLPTPAPALWPPVTAVVPARNEAAHIRESIGSLLAQVYPGAFNIILVDDQSSDGTAEAAKRTAQGPAAGRLSVLAGRALPGGWTGKLWAVKQGVAAAVAGPEKPGYLLLTDADIVYAPRVLSALVAQSVRDGLVLNSRMAKLRCESFAECSHVPAFIFFFQMLYPFDWVNRSNRSMAAAAGGCMLVEAEALQRAGGIEAIGNALIDDCALARLLKAQGPIRLRLTDLVRSIRPYPDIDEFGRMVSRSAYAQLRYSPLLLAGTVLGMALTYLAPPLLALFGDGIARWLGLTAWLMMALAYQPTLRFYRLSPAWGLALPAIALSYLWFTVRSALDFMRGKGGMWKGRVQASRP